jgi:predicted DNA-binding transcriptional regulator AlpA
LRARGYSDAEILETPDALQSRAIEEAARDPVLGSVDTTRMHCGGISEMTFWRWRRNLNFPRPDIVICGKNYWRLSTIDAWLDTQAAKQSVGGAR